MADELLELDALKYDLLIKEIICKTNNCGIIWSRDSPSVFTAAVSTDPNEYRFFIIRFSGGILLDIAENGRIIVSLVSSFVPEVDLLYAAIEKAADRDPSITRMQEFTAGISDLRCQQIGIQTFGGIKIS